MCESLANHDLARTLRALADPNRLAILDFLRDPIQSCCSRADGVCGCDLEAFLGVSQPTVSHHMKQLVEVGLVSAEKRGRWVYYDLNPVAFTQVVVALEPYATFVSDTAKAVLDDAKAGQ
jgi:ArsR family transcriptional regulator